MRRVYADVSNFRAPYDSPNLTLTGLGTTGFGKMRQWGGGRKYYDVSNFRAPYDTGYFQDNSLMGADVSQHDVEGRAPHALRRYLLTGEPMPTLGRDLAAASAQVPQWAWLAGSGLTLVGAYLAYRSFSKAGKKPTKA